MPCGCKVLQQCLQKTVLYNLQRYVRAMRWGILRYLSQLQSNAGHTYLHRLQRRHLYPQLLKGRLSARKFRAPLNQVLVASSVF